MKVVWTEAARADLDDILSYTKEHFPAQLEALERRIKAVVERVVYMPESARSVVGRRNVRVVPLIRYPFKLYYRVEDDQLQILHIHHTARRPWAR
jgi:plasmid stabilization system protein ParE